MKSSVKWNMNFFSTNIHFTLFFSMNSVNFTNKEVMFSWKLCKVRNVLSETMKIEGYLYYDLHPKPQ